MPVGTVEPSTFGLVYTANNLPTNLTAQPLQDLADTRLLKALSRKHPDYERNITRWQLLRKLVAGGKAVDDKVRRQILVNPDGRPESVIKERLRVAAYVNKISPILTRFNAQLFEKDGTYTGGKDPYWTDTFFESGARLPADDDNRASFFTFLRESMFEALTTGKCLAQVDTQVSSAPLNREAQKGLREDEPYVVLRYQDSLWDWAIDGDGFRYCKLHDFQIVRPNWADPPFGQHRFTIFEKDEQGRVLTSVYLIRKIVKPGQPPDISEFPLDGMKPGEDVTVEPLRNAQGQEVVQQEVWSLGGEYKFPLVTLTLPEPLCIADQLLDCQISYFNVLAGILWKLQSLNFAMPVLTGGSTDDDDPLANSKWGDGFYLRLPEGYSLGSLEIGGSAISSANSQLEKIETEIRAIIYQLSLSAADGAAIKAQSAQSKREDTRVERIMLEVFGQMIREYAKQVLDVAAIARGEAIEWDVDGFTDFQGDSGLLEDITNWTQLQMLPVPSIAFKKEVSRDIARRYSSAFDTDEKVLEEILKEIDSASEEDFQPPQPPGVETNGQPGNQEKAQIQAQEPVQPVPKDGQKPRRGKGVGG